MTPPNPGDPVVPLARAIAIARDAVGKAYRHEPTEAASLLHAAAVPWPATPTTPNGRTTR